MRTWKLRSWRTAGVAALALAACGGEGGESAGEAGAAGEAGEGEGGEPVISAPVETEGAAAGAGGEGEGGEAGAATAYAGLAGDERTALRLEHLKGFLMIAQRVAESGAADDAAILVAQGVLEVYDAAPSEFGGLDIAPVRAAADAIGQPQAQIEQRIEAALAAIESARQPLNADEAVVTARLIDVATGLYQGVVQADFVDPIEYQHSHGAALAARDALEDGRDALRRDNRRAYDEAKTEVDRFVALWPSPTAPQTPATYGQVLAQGSRVRLALSPYL